MIFGDLFFPANNELDRLLLAVGSFGISFVARPIGGVVLGLFADRAGRKPAMTLTLTLMALGSLLVACAPTYAQIGMAAPIWLVTARLVQGFALGGEVGASTSLLLEYADDYTRGYYGSWQSFSQGLSSLFGSLLALGLTRWLPHEALLSWGWRVPFAVGVLLVPLGVYIRRHLDETLGPVPEKDATSAGKLKDVFGAHRTIVASGILLLIGGTVSTYIVVFYLATYATRVLSMPLSVSLWASVTSSLVVVLIAPWAGWLSDLKGRKGMILGSRLIQVATIVPCFQWLAASPTAPVLVAVVAFQAVLVAMSAVSSIVMITEMCPRPIRATGLSIIYGLGVAAFGGTAQVVATWLIKVTGNNLAPAWYLIVCNLVSLIPMLYLRETARRPA